MCLLKIIFLIFFNKLKKKILNVNTFIGFFYVSSFECLIYYSAVSLYFFTFANSAGGINNQSRGFSKMQIL